MANVAEATGMRPSPPVSADSGRATRLSPQKPETPRSTRSSASASGKPVHTHTTPQKPSPAQTSPSKPKTDSARKRKPTFVSCITFPETGPLPPPPVENDAELQRSQRKSKVEALNKIDRAGTPTTISGPAATSFVPPPPPPAGPSVTRNPLKRPRVANPPFDISTVRTTAPPDPGPSNEPRAFGLPTCPAYHPTAEEFTDPMAYIESISAEASKYGICKIVPPEGWHMPFELDTNVFRFRTRLQRLNSIEAASRAKINFLEQLSMFHNQQGDADAHIPIIERQLLDLWLLRKEVNKLGGIDEVNRLKAWPSITQNLGYNPTATAQVRAAYTRMVLPFENWALRAKSVPESPLTPLPSANGKPAVNGIAHATPDTPTVAPQGRMGMRTSPKQRAATGAAGSSLSAVSSETQAGPSSVPAPGGALAAPIRIKVPGFQTSSHGSDSELSEEESSRTSSSTSTPEQPAKYERGDVCEICGLGNNAPKILLCDGCDRGFHTFCLDPPLAGIPTNEWYCTACLLGTGDDYGFDEGEDHSLPSFQARDSAFTYAWFNRYRPTHSPLGPLTRRIGNATVSEGDVEKEFWRLVESQDDTVEVEYGADVHSTTHGSAAPTLETHPNSPYAQSPWNLNNVAILRDSLLRYIKSDISGMTVPWIYVGMLFSAFCWHNEDHYTYSVNYMFWGETKTWYGVPGSQAERLETAIKSEAPELFERQPSLLYQLVTMMNPGRIRDSGVDVYACDQRPNEFVITFPKAYHCGFNHGLNFNEAVNFALPDWLSDAKESVLRYKQHAKAPVFSHNELLITITLYSDTIKTALWLAGHLKDMVQDETDRRQRLRLLAPDLPEVVVEEDVPEEQYQCCVCKGFCYLSQMTCSCTKLVTCLEHSEQLCACPWSSHTLRERFSEAQLQDILDVVVARAQQPEQWETRRQALLEVARPSLKSLKQLVTDGERIPYPLKNFDDMSAFVARANSWLERATAISTRKSTGRRRKGRQSEVAADDEDVDRSPEALEALVREADQLAFDAPEIAQLWQIADSMKSFRKEAAVILQTPDAKLNYEDCKTALILGQSLNVELPEVAELAKVVARLQWYHKVEEEVDDRTLQYSDIVNLLEEASECGIPEDHSGVTELRRREQTGRAWKEAVDKLLSSKFIALDDISNLVSGQEYTPTSVETMRQLENIKKTAVHWKMQALNLLAFGGTAGSAQRLCKAVRSASGPLGRVEIPEIAKLEAELDFTAQWSKGIADVLNVPVNKVASSINQLQRQVEAHLRPEDDYPDAKDAAAGSKKVACFCRDPETNSMLECPTCKGKYHPKCVGVNVKSASGIAAAQKTFQCQMCLRLQYNDRPSLTAIGAFTDPVKWNFVIKPPEFDLLQKTTAAALRYATVLVPVIDPWSECHSRTLTLVGHLLRKMWNLPIVMDAFNTATKEMVVFEEWLHYRLRELQGKSARGRARKPKFHLAGAHPHEFSCICTTEPLDHLLTISCTKCQQGFHLSCVQAPIALANGDARVGWRCPFCIVKTGKAPPRGQEFDLRIQMEDKLGTSEFVHWRKTLAEYAETPIPLMLPPSHDAVVLTCTKFSPPTVPEGFERPVFVEQEEADNKRKRRKTETAPLPVANSRAATSSPAVSRASGATVPPSPVVYAAAPAVQSALVGPAVPSQNEPAKNVRSNGRLYYPTHSIVPWSNTEMFSQFQVAPRPPAGHPTGPPTGPPAVHPSGPSMGPAPASQPPQPHRFSADTIAPVRPAHHSPPPAYPVASAPISSAPVPPRPVLPPPAAAPPYEEPRGPVAYGNVHSSPTVGTANGITIPAKRPHAALDEAVAAPVAKKPMTPNPSVQAPAPGA